MQAVTAAHSWRTPEGRVTGLSTPAAPPTPPPGGTTGWPRQPWPWDPQTAIEGGAEQKKKNKGQRSAVKVWTNSSPWFLLGDRPSRRAPGRSEPGQSPARWPACCQSCGRTQAEGRWTRPPLVPGWSVPLILQTVHSPSGGALVARLHIGTK